MRVYNIVNDRFMDRGIEVDQLGWEYNPTKLTQIDINLIDAEFPWTRACLSIGDWAIVSALPRLLKTKYPGIQVYLPSTDWLRRAFDSRSNQWKYENSDPINNIDIIFANNPYVAGRFQVGQFDTIVNDHYRCYRFTDEPLVEKLIRALGFTEQEIMEADTRPELYFSPEEQERGDEIIKKYIGNDRFGCLLLASRIDRFNKLWPDDHDKNLILDLTEQYRDYPVFYYSTWDVQNSKWGKIFKDYYNFSEIPGCDLRIQLYLKSKAVFNTGYQAGVNDSIGGGLNGSVHNMFASPYNSLGDNVIRGNTYYLSNRSKVIY
jgi:hypothetical protein